MRAWILAGGCLLGAPALLVGQGQYFAGAMGGVSTLSADGRSMVSEAESHVSSYKPENGPTALVIGGRHFNDYLSAQASYGWNRNDLTLTSTQYAGDEFRFHEQRRRGTQHTVMGEMMLYFRKRTSWVRPYLSAGLGAAHFASGTSTIRGTTGDLPAPAGFSSTKPALRVAVGIDLMLKHGFAFRFIFSETIRGNTISAELSPPGKRNLANFQNLFGFVKCF